jgi:hypothetical protein
MDLFWDLCTDPDSNINTLDSRCPRQRQQILHALEDPRTYGEWLERGHKALLYGEDQGVVVFVHDTALVFILNDFFTSESNVERVKDSND